MTTLRLAADSATAGREHDPLGSADAGGSSAPRPQPLMLTFLGQFLLGSDLAVYSGSVIDVFDKIGVSEQAVRSILARMAARDLLERHRRGRKIYFGLTPRSTATLEDGRRRIRQGVLNDQWDGAWTLIGFSLPETARRERHDLRSRLIWGGFGILQNGLWVAPGVVDAAALLDGLAADGFVNVFSARAANPTEDEAIVRTAFDPSAIADRYREFLRRWDTDDPVADAADDLVRRLLLQADWLQLVRSDPRLPSSQLPSDWPAIRAQHVFEHLDHDLAGGAESIAATLDRIELHVDQSPPPTGPITASC